MPTDPQYIPTQEDYNQVENMVNVWKHCVDKAQGNPKVFDNEWELFRIRN